MDIDSASKELYSKLRIYDEVVGVGICLINGENYIVVYLTTPNKILDKIPTVYKGISVTTEITGGIFLQ